MAMMTISQYRDPEREVSLPVNGAGLQMPQLIDDLYEARKHLIDIRTKTNYSVYQSVHLVEAIGYMNRALDQLGITLKDE